MGAGRAKNKQILAIVSIVVAAAVVLLVGGVFMRNYFALRNITGELQEVDGQLDAVEARHDELQSDYDHTRDESFIRQMARELLGWVFPGEVRIVEEPGG